MIGAGYTGLFLTSFLAATLVPLSSEAVLAVLISAQGFDLALLIGIATVGNTLGAVVNWLLGRYCLRWRDRRWFPVGPDALDRASRWVERYGVWTLLLSWLPLVGDPLTFAAGVLGVRFPIFLILVAVGKGARYALVGAVSASFFE